MSQITPQIVKELREKTGAGMGDCKNALVDANGDMQAAIEILRKKGAASAAKRADRSAKEGLVIAKTTPDGKHAIVVEINCETDFVARNAEFERYAEVVSNALFTGNFANVDELLTVKVGNDTVQGIHNEILAKFSENIGIRRFATVLSEGFIEAYNHLGNKLGVLIEVNTPTVNEKARTMIHDIAMQVAAMNPLYISRDMVPADKIAKEIEIYREIAEQEGKKPEIAERVATGRLEKFYQENCLVEQAFVKDAQKTVNDVIKEISAECGTDVKISSMNRFFLGESLD
jgi:elongation factor Ts